MTGAALLQMVRVRVRSVAYLRKWILLGATIGVISGLGAALFFVALDLGTRFFLGTLAGFVPASPLGEGARPITDAARPWALPLVVAPGGLLAGVLADGHQSWVPVVANDHLAGILSVRDVVVAYRGALAANVRRVNTIGSIGSLLEAEIDPASVLAGRPVSETAWPRDSVLVSVMPGEKVIVPRGNVVLEAGDHLTVFTAPAAREALHTLLASRIATEAEAS